MGFDFRGHQIYIYTYPESYKLISAIIKFIIRHIIILRFISCYNLQIGKQIYSEANHSAVMAL